MLGKKIENLQKFEARGSFPEANLLLVSGSFFFFKGEKESLNKLLREAKKETKIGVIESNTKLVGTKGR